MTHEVTDEDVVLITGKCKDKNSTYSVSGPKKIRNPVTGSVYDVAERTSKTGTSGKITGLWSNPEKTIDVKGAILPDLGSGDMIHPLKGGQHNRILSAVVEKPLTWYLERAGVAFSMSGAAVCSLPASMLNTFVTNGFFLVGDLFLLALWIRERRFWLIVQNAVFAALAAYGVINNAGVFLNV